MNEQSGLRHTKKARIYTILRYAALILISFTMIMPLLWMITISLKGNSAIFVNPPEWIPKEFHWENYAKATRQIDFWRKMFNTLVITGLSTLGTVVSCLCVAYALSRIKFPGRKFWFYVIIFSMMLPGMVTLIPMFKMFTAIGWYNTWLPLIVPAWFGSSFYTFLLRQNFMGLPVSFDEAAKIDGAGHLQILFKILVPISKPAIAVVVISQVLVSWNDYLNPLVYLVDSSKWTLSVAMASFSSAYSTAWNLFMSADLLYMLPLLILFFCCQKYFMQGLGSLNSAALK